MKSKRVKIAAGAAAAVAVAGGGAAIGASQPWNPKEESQAVLNDAAKQLGVSPDKLSAALKQALKDRVDSAVAAGRLTKAQGDELLARIDAGVPFALAGPGWGLGFGHVGDLSVASTYLGLSEDALRTKLESGQTLAQIAKDQGKSVDGLVQALVKDAGAKIDQAVAAGRLTKDQADQLKSGLEQRITALVNGTVAPGEHLRGGPGWFFGPGHAWRGQGYRPGGPPAFGEQPPTA